MLVIFLALLFTLATSKSLPPNIIKCSISDPKLAECLDKNVEDAVRKLSSGNRDLGVVPLEPLQVERLAFGNSSAGAVAIQQTYENLRLFGITNATMSGSEVNLADDNCYWRFTTFTPRVIMESNYKMTGRLLIFPINGHGKCKNTLYDIESKYSAKCEKYSKKGKKHIKVTDFDFEIRPKKVVFDFENLIDRNEQLSKEVVKTLNENSEVVYKDVSPAFDEVMARIWKETINRVFSKVPQEELFLP